MRTLADIVQERSETDWQGSNKVKFELDDVGLFDLCTFEDEGVGHSLYLKVIGKQKTTTEDAMLHMTNFYTGLGELDLDIQEARVSFRTSSGTTVSVDTRTAHKIGRRLYEISFRVEEREEDPYGAVKVINKVFKPLFGFEFYEGINENGEEEDIFFPFDIDTEGGAEKNDSSTSLIPGQSFMKYGTIPQLKAKRIIDRLRSEGVLDNDDVESLRGAYSELVDEYPRMHEYTGYVVQRENIQSELEYAKVLHNLPPEITETSINLITKKGCVFLSNLTPDGDYKHPLLDKGSPMLDLQLFYIDRQSRNFYMNHCWDVYNLMTGVPLSAVEDTGFNND